jgi:hypothetical protein
VRPHIPAWVAAPVAALTLALSLAACGGDDDDDGASADPGTTAPGAEAPPPTAAAPAAAAPAPAAPGAVATSTTASAGGFVEVIATEYAFAVANPVPAGATSVRLVNQGAEDHELVIGRIADGKTYQDARTTTDLLSVVPATETLQAKPGQATEVAIDIGAGEWYMACFLTTPDGRSHADAGMVGSFTAA